MPAAYAPIALFVYNRLDHLVQTIDALRANELAQESELYVFSDGPRHPTDEPKVSKVRQYLKNISGFKRIEIIEAPGNQGLADSIIGGASRLVNEFGRVIVLEDDVITSPRFLRFMNDALNFYENEPRVMHISGYVFPFEETSPTETFLMTPTTCWGWATWKRSWQHFNRDANALIAEFSPQMIREFDINGATPYFFQLTENQKGNMKTWAIFWYATVFLDKGLSLHPTHSLCQNIGHDGTGENCSENTIYEVALSNKPITRFETNITESILYRSKFETFLRNSKPTLLQRIQNKIKKLSARALA